VVSAVVASLRRRRQRGVMGNLCVAACVRRLTEVVAGMQLSRGTTPSLPFAYAPASSPPSLPVFTAGFIIQPPGSGAGDQSQVDAVSVGALHVLE
jgi:hypothetical protein